MKINGIVVKVEDKVHLFKLDDKFEMINPSMPISEGIYKNMKETKVYFVNVLIINENKDEMKINIKDFFSVTLLKEKKEVTAKEFMDKNILSEIVSDTIKYYLKEKNDL